MLTKHLIICLVLLFAGWSNAATLHVGSGQTYATIALGRAAASGGDTIIVHDGTYNETFADADNYWPNGSAGAYTIIKAENDGGAIVTGQVYISRTNSPAHTSQYLQIEGFKFKGALAKEVRGNHIKFLRCAFEGGPATGNASTIDVGTSDYNDTAYILFEDCWAYGQGGRYNISVFNADHIVLRRMVIRHDSGWDDREKSDDPEAGINIYNSSYCEIQNCIVIDSDRPITSGASPVAGEYSTWQGSVYIIHNNESEGAGGIVHPTDNNYVRGTISLNVTRLCYMEDGSGQTVADYSDIVCWKSTGGAISGGSSGGDCDMTINRASFGGSTGTDEYAGDGAVSEWDNGSITITNSIITGFERDFHPSANVTRSYIDIYDNAETNSPCSNCVTVNPFTRGWSYNPRIETSSYLTTAGSSGGQIGATILKRIGTSSTLWGETGYATATDEDLWPFPYEDRIKTDFASVATLGGMVGARGFAATGNQLDGETPITLTSYIWEALGNQIPADIYGEETSSLSGMTCSGCRINF